jgi:hypothetical protein
MSQTVNIDGVGPVEFPDGMSRGDMAHAIETELMPGLKSGGLKLGGASPAAQSPAAPTGPQSPLGGAIPTAAEMVAHGATGLASIGQEAGQVATNATDALRAVNSAVPFSDRLIAGYKTLAGGGGSRKLSRSSHHMRPPSDAPTRYSGRTVCSTN